MVISILYWRSVWTYGFRKPNSNVLTHSPTVEEAKAFERRLMALRNANFKIAPPTAEQARDRAD